MSRLHLFTRLYATYLLAVALTAVAVGWYAIDSARSLYLRQVESDLAAQAHVVERQTRPLVLAGDGAALGSLVRELWQASGTRITVIARDGVVLADSELPAASLENHATRPEVRVALGGGTGQAIRHSESLNVEMMYVAIPSTADGRLIAIVRTALPMTDMHHALDDLYLRIALSALAVAVAVALIGLVVSRRISGQMGAIREGAGRFAAGDFSRKLPVTDAAEIGGVATSLNQMADQLSDTIDTITRQRNEREAILSSMVEGVLAVDDDQRVITLNEAAAELLGVSPDEVEGRGIEEVARNVEVQRFVSDALAGERAVEGEITVKTATATRYLQVTGSRLRTDAGGSHGAVIVLNDVTRLKHLERVRRDFVANVSHEIKTPVTSIKGFAETLADGALDDPVDARRFLQIIVRQADRLNAIIEDLLSLSRLETAGDDEVLGLERLPLADVLHAAVEVCALRAEARHIEMSVECPPALTAAIDPPLLEQAVINLVDNAIKYSSDGSAVHVEGRPEPDGVTISVIDHGIGIGREHLDRLFERFYRIDKARSRDMGGTGLGLAIVKHIAQAHGGSVSVESVPGIGSTFRIRLRG